MHNVLLRKIVLSFFVCCFSSPLIGADKNTDTRSFTINYTNISLLEYVRFVSKITNSNFVFNEEDLNFTITVLSEEPVTPDNVMATLLQILRMHNLSILEDGNNLVIQRGANIKQLGSIVSEKEGLNLSTPISTKLFRIKNANVSSIAAIIKPFISESAQLEISLDTRQIIITDITQNIERISELISNLDSSTSPLSIETYAVKFGNATALLEPLKKIITPLANNNPYILVPQESINTIYIVSTPQLIERSLSILGKLDVKSTHKVTKALKPENIFIYKPLYLSPDKLEDSLDELRETLLHQGHSEEGLVTALSDMEYIKETGSFLFSADNETISKLKEILATIDTPSKEHAAIANNSFFTYKPQFKTAKEVKEGIEEITKTLSSEKEYKNVELLNTLKSAKIVDSTKSVLFTGDPKTFSQIQDLLKTVDISSGTTQEKSTFFIYTIKNASPNLLQQSLKDMAKYLDASKVEDQALIESIKTMKYIQDTHSLVFSGPPSTLKRVEEVVTNFDLKSLGESEGRQTYIVYKIKNASYTGITNSLKEMEKYLDSSNIEDKQLIDSMKTMKYIKDTNSLAFSGSKETLERLQTLLTSLDVKDNKIEATQYYIYTPQFVSGEKLKEQILNTEKHLKESNLSDPMFLQSMSTVRWDKESNSLIFTGDSNSLNQVKELLTKVDNPQSPDAIATGPQTYFLYNLQDVSEESMEDYLKELSHTLNNIKEKTTKDKELIRAIDSRQYVKESNAFMFYGSADSIKDLTPILTKYDSASHENKSSYFLYKLQHSSGEVVEENLHDFAKKLKKSPDVEKSHANLIKLIDNIRWIKETNSLMLTGNPEAINEAKELIQSYDIASHEKKQTDQFYIYKPKYITAVQLETYLKQTLTDLKEAGLTDSNLIRSVNDMKVSKQTNSVVFTGSEATLTRVKELLIDVDNETLATLDDKNATFLLYKLQQASGPEVIKSIEGVAKDLSSLSKQSEEDKQFLDTLNSVKYVDKTNSLLFTGTAASLDRTKKLLSNFDVPQLATPTQVATKSSFFVYKPKNLPGPELKTILGNFAQKLKSSGVTDTDLFKTLESVQWTEATNSLVITGTQTSLDRTQELLKTFDVPSGGLYPDAVAPIQDIDDTSFLVYKLQFHKGEEIQIALRAVARDLLNSGSKVNTDLLNSISSIRLIPMTNSLLCSGTPETLKRLKELIRNLDIPLKQVFIEMLVIETSTVNTLSFGLGWSSKFDYRGRTVASVGNNSSNTSSFFNNFNNIDANTSPTGSDVGVFNDGFNLGVIGDIIKHKGETYLTLGSLAKAVEADGNSSIVMTPKLITQDSKTSEIFIGQNVPFIGSFVSNAGANTIETQNLEYRDIGVNLILTPVLGNSDIVTLRLEMSRTAGTGAGGQITQTSVGGVTGVTTSKTTMNTTVHIPNKNFLVLTGMANSSKARNKQGIPCLGGLPIIGAAFTDTNETDQNTNIVIFIKPHIITSYEDMAQLTENQEDFFRDNAGSFEVEKDFEEAMELIRSIDDD